MIRIISLLAISSLLTLVSCSSEPESQIVDASCGLCHFEMDDEMCELAVRIAGEVYHVEGTGLNDHGDAHAEDGFCSMVRKAKVQGEVVDDLFKARSFELLPLEGE